MFTMATKEKKLSKSKHHCFTLLEVLISVAIFSFLIASVFAFMTMGNLVWNTDINLLSLQQEARQAMNGMTHELRQADSSSVTITSGGSQIEFYIPDITNSIKYYLNTNQIIREHPTGTTRVLASNASSLSFCCPSGASCTTSCSGLQIVDIKLTMHKTVRQIPLNFPATGNFEERVRMRND